MDDRTIIELIAFIGTLCAIVFPVIKAFSGYTARLETLVERLESLEERYDERHKELAERVKDHGQEIDKLNIGFENHEVRLKGVEKHEG